MASGIGRTTLALYWAAELQPHGIATIAVTPGFLRSESMLQHFGVTEDNWRDGGKKDSNFLQSESPLFVGRAVTALATDPNVMNRTGMLFSSWELARIHRLRRPASRLGRHAIDFSMFPPSFVDPDRGRPPDRLAERAADAREEVPHEDLATTLRALTLVSSMNTGGRVHIEERARRVFKDDRSCR